MLISNLFMIDHFKSRPQILIIALTFFLVSFLQGACVSKIKDKGKLEGKATKQIVALLSAPLEKYNDIDTALKLSNYPLVLEYLDDRTNKVMSNVIIQSIMKNKTHISTAEKVWWLFSCYAQTHQFLITVILLQVGALFELIRGLIKDLDADSDSDDEVTFISSLSYNFTFINMHVI